MAEKTTKATGETAEKAAAGGPAVAVGDFDTPGAVPGWFSTAEAAARLGVDKSRLDQMARRNDPRIAGHTRAGQTRLFPAEKIKAYHTGDRKPGPKSALNGRPVDKSDQPALPFPDAGSRKKGKKKAAAAKSKEKPGKPVAVKPDKDKSKKRAVPKKKPKPVGPKPSANGDGGPARKSRKKSGKKVAAAA